MSLIVPAVLPSSLEDLKEKLALFAKLPAVSRVQIDVVDGKFAGILALHRTSTIACYGAKRRDAPFSRYYCV